MSRKRISYGTKLPVTFKVADVEMMSRELFIDTAVFRLGMACGRTLTFKLSLDDIEDLQGHVAAEMNHTKDKKLEKRLRSIWEYLQEFIEGYDDEWEL